MSPTVDPSFVFDGDFPAHLLDPTPFKLPETAQGRLLMLIAGLNVGYSEIALKKTLENTGFKELFAYVKRGFAIVSFADSGAVIDAYHKLRAIKFDGNFLRLSLPLHVLDKIMPLSQFYKSTSMITPASSPGNKVYLMDVSHPEYYYEGYYPHAHAIPVLMPMEPPMPPPLPIPPSHHEIDYRCNVYVKWLPGDITEETLRQAFLPFGNIRSVRVQRDTFGTSKGYGFILYDTPVSAYAAINAMSGKMLGNREIHCSMAKRKKKDTKSQMEEIVDQGFEEFQPETHQSTPTRRFPNSRLPKSQSDGSLVVEKQDSDAESQVSIVLKENGTPTNRQRPKGLPSGSI